METDRRQADDLLCPSAPATEGAQVIGLMGADGVLGYLGTPMTATREFIDLASRRGEPTERIRFSSPCQEAACLHWRDERCGLSEQLVARNDAAGPVVADDDRLPACAIRARCRWFAQEGVQACRVCPIVTRQVPGIDRSPKSGAETGR